MCPTIFHVSVCAFARPANVKQLTSATKTLARRSRPMVILLNPKKSQLSITGMEPVGGNLSSGCGTVCGEVDVVKRFAVTGLIAATSLLAMIGTSIGQN